MYGLLCIDPKFATFQRRLEARDWMSSQRPDVVERGQRKWCKRVALRRHSSRIDDGGPAKRMYGLLCIDPKFATFQRRLEARDWMSSQRPDVVERGQRKWCKRVALRRHSSRIDDVGPAKRMYGLLCIDPKFATFQ